MFVLLPLLLLSQAMNIILLNASLPLFSINRIVEYNHLSHEAGY